ncbi:MAG TPA: DUF4157 domain-containing protein [Rhizomicrobium sp.]
MAAAAGFDLSAIPARGGGVPGFQAKLTMGGAHDAFEREADQAADRALSGKTPSAPLARASGSSGSGGDAPSSVRPALDTTGRPLDAATRAFMEPRFGHDFSQVRVHTDDKAAASARAAHAKAFTVGHDVVMGAGQYAPQTSAGRKLLGHELAHVVQQGGRRDRLQRLIREPYPWKGVVVSSIGVNIRKAAGSTDKGDILFSLPKDEKVEVLSAQGDWLKIRTSYTGKSVEGWCVQAAIDDATASAMKGDLGTKMSWKPFQTATSTDFGSWASAAKEAPLAIADTTTMNCWEAVLYSAYQAKSIDWKWIHNLYANVPVNDWVTTMSKGALTPYAIPAPAAPAKAGALAVGGAAAAGAVKGGVAKAKPKQKMPQRGDLVFFGGLAHVALATGKGSEVYTFWPPPDTPFKAGASPDRVKTSTIEALVKWTSDNLGLSLDVKFGAPNW